MSRWWGVSLALVFVLAGCGDEELPVAEDGTDFAACGDGDCEVLVRDGDVVEVAGLGRVEVAVDGEMLEVAVRSDDGQGNRSELAASGVAEQVLVLNDQEFTVVAVVGDQGVLRVGG
jgi:hypothetical protein